MAIKLVRGKEGIIVWRRPSWTSMPHLVGDQVQKGVHPTRCGHEVELGYGTVAIVLTQISSDLFMQVGCGMCRMSMMRDLRAELIAAKGDGKAELKRLLKELDWAEDTL